MAQRAFAEIEAYWRRKGAETFEIRQCADLRRGMDFLALPGGESTVQGKLLKDLGLLVPLRERIDGGLPVFATCAGLILLAEKIENDGGRAGARPSQWFGVLPVTVRRNAYGRQLGSFRTVGTFDGNENVPMRKCIEDVTSLQLRLKKIIGQLTGIQKMLAEDVPCEDILTQLNAANGALHRLSFIILDGHFRHCVREGMEKGDADETIESLIVTVLVPDNFFADAFHGNDWIAMPVMALVGFPMYVCSTASIPIAASLIAKGVSPGAAFVFLMVGPAMNAMSLTTISALVGRKAAAAYVAVIVVGAILCGIAINLVPNALPATSAIASADHSLSAVHWASATFLAAMIVYNLVRPVAMGHGKHSAK